MTVKVVHLTDDRICDDVIYQYLEWSVSENQLNNEAGGMNQAADARDNNVGL